MIFYFSATGNSRYVAQQISKARVKNAYDLLKIMGEAVKCRKDRRGSTNNM